jgi:glutamate N-acetyltransferase/amino-acid N-acetyltransferase
VALPDGFAALVGRAGVRTGAGNDVALLWSTTPASSAAMFTRNRFAGPSVSVSRARAASGRARGVVVIAGNANVATGPRGLADAYRLGSLAARVSGLGEEEMLVASTGVIGRPYPMDVLETWFDRSSRQERTSDACELARAMMTTDTVPKVADRQAGAARVVGVAKGVGMIEPDMATMLAFVATDAAIEPAPLERLWRRCVDDTFNCLSVDGDTSTSDTAAVFANGAAGPVAEGALAAAVREVCLDLTLQLARDGEGATKLLTVAVTGARDRSQARRVAKAVLNSPLVKTAVHGGDPNWGRVAMAVGTCADEDIDPDRVTIRFGELETYPDVPDAHRLATLAEVMAADQVEIGIDLGIAGGEATVWGCDLSAEYVRINADYTT